MANLTLFRVERVEVERAPYTDMNVTYITVHGGDGRMTIALHSAKPLSVSVPYCMAEMPEPKCSHTGKLVAVDADVIGECKVICTDCGEQINA